MRHSQMAQLVAPAHGLSLQMTAIPYNPDWPSKNTSNLFKEVELILDLQTNLNEIQFQH